MKKLLIIALAVLMVFSMFSCNTDNKKPLNTDDMSSKSSETQMETEPASETKKEEPKEKMYTEPKANVEKQDVIYKKASNVDLYMTIYQPKKKVYDKAPVFYLVTGGGWNTCDRAGMVTMMSSVVDYLRQRGFVATTIDYRYLGNGAKDMADIISDCMDGIRYLINFEDVLKIDKTKIVTCGHSAGGHLAMITALGDQSKFVNDSPFGLEGYEYTPAASIGLSGLYACYNVSGKLLTACTHISQLFGGSRNNDATHEASPLDCITANICPTLIITGDKDSAVDAKNTYLFRDKAAEVGADVTTIISENAGHTYSAEIAGETVSIPFTQILKSVAEFAYSKVTQ